MHSLNRRLYARGQRLLGIKQSSMVPMALGGALIGGTASRGAASLSGDPRRDPKTETMRGAAVGTGLGLGAAALAGMPRWAVLPGVLLAGSALYNANASPPSPQQVIPQMRR